MHSSLRLSALSRFLESPAPSHTHFPVLDSPATSIPWPGASLAGKKCSCSGGDLPLARGTLHSRRASRPRSRLIDGRVDCDQFHHCDPH